ncbi:MAG TPA: MAPEG family protein [Porticoccaceae bacterium]|nr:MAPEG family protein [Gammaproteobacteria bacterium]HIL61226.1 MAPEG family protein [Porticoccaceae bacterium]
MGRQCNNFFEVPTLFCAAGIIYIPMKPTAYLPYMLVWVYVALRTIYTAIHFRHNNVLPRITILGLGNL